ncbi:Mbeg1-like protein [Alloscardovia macacae]|uniref:DUF2974 domain-containing protein n=1 Tax=Alloscardovia macacae TaxID=1160091 RepID=A0A261F524_9BIFI|nr:Mbeg1-like protein [Alloscardovia macacae]OZG54143.1 hypothetical protein ALMA_0604 [Alloscardovia macacae]
MNILTYAQTMLEPFDAVPFNDVDASILAQLSYAQLDDGCVPTLEVTRALYEYKCAQATRRTPANLWSALLHRDDPAYSFDARAALSDEERFVSLTEAFWRREDFETIFPTDVTRDMMVDLVAALTSSPRFRDVRVGEFTYEFNDERHNDKQFAAMTFLLPNGTEVLSFRGTESSFVGWREDFELAYEKVIPSQTAAVEYVKEMARHAGVSRELILAGHSKGGNTAVYAASVVPEDIQKHIAHVYTFDGPGFITDLLETPGYQRIAERITKLIPQDSFVGLMFKGREPYSVVHSSASGFNEHFMYHWDVDVASACFVPEESVTSTALNIADSYVQWTDSLDIPTRRKVIDSMFAIFESTGYSSFAEISSNMSTAGPVMWQAAYGADPAVRDVVITAFRDLFSLIFGFNRSLLQVEGFLSRLPFGFGQSSQGGEQ